MKKYSKLGDAIDHCNNNAQCKCVGCWREQLIGVVVGDCYTYKCVSEDRPYYGYDSWVSTDILY